MLRIRRMSVYLTMLVLGLLPPTSASAAEEDCPSQSCTSGDLYQAALDAVGLACAANGVSMATAIYFYGEAWCADGTTYAVATCY